MKTLDENLKRMKSLISVKHGKIFFINEEEEEKKEKSKDEEKSKDKEKIISLEDELLEINEMYDSDIAKDIDDLLEELLFDSDINPLKKKIIDLIKSREEN